MHIAINELKSSLSRVLAEAQAGKIFEITCHNKPIARIVGIPQQQDAALSKLMMSGALTWNGKKPQFEAPLQLNKGLAVSQMVLEDRA